MTSPTVITGSTLDTMLAVAGPMRRMPSANVEIAPTVETSASATIQPQPPAAKRRSGPPVSRQ